MLERLWLLDPVPAWRPTRSHLSRFGAASKHHLADPALAARLLGATRAGLLENAEIGPAVTRGSTLLGTLFESEDKRVVAIEVKLECTVKDDDTRSLRWL